MKKPGFPGTIASSSSTEASLSSPMNLSVPQTFSDDEITVAAPPPAILHLSAVQSLPELNASLNSMSSSQGGMERAQSESFVRDGASSRSSRSIKSLTLVKKLSTAFSRKKKKSSPMEMHVRVVAVADESILRQDSVISSDAEASGKLDGIREEDFREERKRLDTVKESLLLIAERLSKADTELERAVTARQLQSRDWMIRTVCLLLVAVGLVLLDHEMRPLAWLLGFVVSVLLLLFGNDRTSESSVELAARELASARRMLSQAASASHQASERKLERQASLKMETESAQVTVAKTSPIPDIPGFEHFDVKGFRLNFFQGVQGLDFERDALGPLSAERKAIFAQFERAFAAAFDPRTVQYKENIPDRFTLLRFLQSDKYDVDKALARMIKTVAWRESSGWERFIDNFDWKLVQRGYALRPQVFCGFDKHKRPLYVEKLGEFFGNDEAFRGLSIKDWIRVYTVYIGTVCLSFRRAAEQGGPFQHRMAYIGDISGIRVLQAAKLVGLLKTLVKEVETHFPEFAGPIILVNCPGYMMRLYGIVRKFLDPATVEKIHVASDNGVKYLEEFYGLDVVPVEYGGKNPIKVPSCAKRVDDEFNAKYPYTPSE